MRFIHLIILASICSLPVILRGAAPTTQQADANGRVVRTYDVSDVLTVERDYPLTGSMIPTGSEPPAHRGGGGGEGGMPGVAMGFGGPEGAPVLPSVVASSITLQSLANTVIETIDRDSWQQGARVTAVGNVLVVSQTPANHEIIRELLDGLSKELAPKHMMSVRAYWLMLEAADLETITKASGGQANALQEIPAELLDAKKIYSTGQTLGFSGQTVHITSQRGQSVAKGVSPVVGTNAVGYNVEMATVQSGVALQLTPRILSDGNSAVIDLQSYVTEVDRGKPIDVSHITATTRPESQIPELLTLDRSSVIAQQFSSTVRIPLGKKILIGGMTMDPSRTDASRQLFLVIEASASK